MRGFERHKNGLGRHFALTREGYSNAPVSEFAPAIFNGHSSAMPCEVRLASGNALEGSRSASFDSGRLRRVKMEIEIIQDQSGEGLAAVVPDYA